MALDPPYSTGIFETIVDCHFGGLYLVVFLSGSNGAFASPPSGNVRSPGPATLSANKQKAGVRLIETATPSNLNNSSSGFLNCLVYSPSSVDADTAYFHQFGGSPELSIATGGFAATDFSSCPWPGPGAIPENTAVVPINHFAFDSNTTVYLYSIPEDNVDKLLQITVAGLVATTPNPTTTSTTGGGEIAAFVYSRVRGTVKHITDLRDLDGDGKPRPTEDDQVAVGIDSTNQGSFFINVKLDEDPDNQQIDNYGETFQPYKVSLSPNIGTDMIPEQPPPRLKK